MVSLRVAFQWSALSHTIRRAKSERAPPGAVVIADRRTTDPIGGRQVAAELLETSGQELAMAAARGEI